MNHIMYLCEVEHREPKLHIAASYYMKGNHLKNWLEKSDFKFNLPAKLFNRYMQKPPSICSF